MRKEGYRNTKVAEKSAEIILPGGNHAVLLIHGFTGITNHFAFLGEVLNKEGYSVRIPRLPGHGTNRYDFFKTSHRDWLRRSIDIYLDMSRKYESVSLGGLSMGGLLALILAGRFNPEKVMLYAPALVLRRKLAYLSPLLKFFIPRMKSDYDEKHEDPEMIFLAQEYWMHHETKMIASVEKLRRIALKSLVRITSPTLVFVSQKDMTVPPKAADLILDGIPTPNKKKILLNESSHLITQDEEKEKTAEISVHWLKNQTILTP